MNIISLLRFKQSPVAAKILGHWGILLTECEFRDSDGTACSPTTLFHIVWNEEGKQANFEYVSANEERWQKGGKLIDKVYVGSTELSRNDIELICRKVARNFIFKTIDNNCQDYVQQCLKMMNLDCPVNTTTQSCACLHLIQLSAESAASAGTKSK